MKEMSLQKILKASFTLLICLVLLISLCFGVAQVTNKDSGVKVTIGSTGFEALKGVVTTKVSGGGQDASADVDLAFGDFYENLYYAPNKNDEDVSESRASILKSIAIVSQVVSILILVVSILGMVFAILSAFLFTQEKNNKVNKIFKTLALIFSILLMVVGAILVILSNSFLGIYKYNKELTGSDKLPTYMTYSFIGTLIVIIMMIAEAVTMKILRSKGVGERVFAGASAGAPASAPAAEGEEGAAAPAKAAAPVKAAKGVDIDDLTIEVLRLCKKVADAGVITDIEFAERKRTILIESNSRNVNFLAREASNMGNLAKYHELIKEGVLTESEYAYKKKMFLE